VDLSSLTSSTFLACIIQNPHGIEKKHHHSGKDYNISMTFDVNDDEVVQVWFLTLSALSIFTDIQTG